MATAHVFIVDSTTFDIHLKYLFAGTGAKEHLIDYNNSENSSLHHSVEDMLVAMSADACRIRKDDKIIFYLQQEAGFREGKFYGIFKATSNWSFLDNNDDLQHLKCNLEKSLTFRTLIEPDSVYAEGVTEWEALDDIKSLQSPNQMLWSLIYRKLKGNRGNTMITIYEYERLSQLIRNKNSRNKLNVGSNQLSFDKATQQIVINTTVSPTYTGRQVSLNILPRLIYKFSNNRAFEAHLQAYIVRNIGLGVNTSLDDSVLGKDFSIEWIGNEVSCGVGMQRIDVAVSINQNNQRIFVPMELKAVEANFDNVRQISRYVDWIEQYYIPNRQSDITPIVIAKEFRNKNNPNYSTILEAFRDFNTQNCNRCSAIKYVEYINNNGNLFFNNISY
jgi:hypothetical protein